MSWCKYDIVRTHTIFIFIRINKIDLRPSILIFHQWTSLKMFLFCSYLESAFFSNWGSLHERLNSHYKAWSYKKKKYGRFIETWSKIIDKLGNMQTDFQKTVIIVESMKKNWIFIGLELGHTFTINIQALQMNFSHHHIIILSWKLNHIW